jgi:acetyl-CoA acetyltransferase
MSGVHDVVIAGGVEVMSLVPIGGNAIAATRPAWAARTGSA